MQVEHPNRQELTATDLEHLQELRRLIDRVVADGKVSEADMDMIDQAVRADGKILVEEITLIRQRIQDQLKLGLLRYDW